jgi:ectoine hydroxylase-related dioxygenase (phytanoyl-CoA dioxygenase family)
MGELAMLALPEAVLDRAAYTRDGYTVLRGVFAPAEVARLADEADHLRARGDLTSEKNLRVRWHVHVETGAPTFELFDPVTDIAPAAARAANDPRLVSRVASLLGGPVALLKDKLIYKAPGSGGYPLHQDFVAWPDFPRSFTTVVVAIDPAPAAAGPIEVFPGAHRAGCLAPAQDGQFHILDDEDVARVASAPPVALDLRAGDAAIFGAFMPHRSGVNRSARSRRHLLFSYALMDGASPAARRADHYDAFHHYLRSVYGAMGMGDLFFR